MGEPLIIAGWVLAVPVPRPPYVGSSVPEEILTISDCIQEDLPGPEQCDWYTDLAEAEHVRQQRAPHSQVITVAMAIEDAEAFLEKVTSDQMQPGECLDLLRRRMPLYDDTKILGYEIVGAESYLDFHSWHCHGYADDVAAALGIRTNRYGLLSTRVDARAALAWMLSRPSAEAPKEVPWTVVALVATDQPPE